MKRQNDILYNYLQESYLQYDNMYTSDSYFISIHIHVPSSGSSSCLRRNLAHPSP